MNPRLALALLAVGHDLRKGASGPRGADFFFQPRRGRPSPPDAPRGEISRTIAALAAQWLRTASRKAG